MNTGLPDDHEPITAEWLQLHFERAPPMTMKNGRTFPGSCHHGPLCVNDNNCWFIVPSDPYESVGIEPLETRGEVRWLCQKLGCPITEPA